MSDFENTGVMEVPVQRRINYAGLVIAILAIIMAIMAIVKANSADDHAGEVDKRVTKVVGVQADFAKATIDKLNAHSVELSADATAISVLNNKVLELESKSVVAALAKELREGKASKTSVDILRDEVLLKADAKTVRRLAKRMGKFDSRINNIVELNKLVEVAPQPTPAPAPTPQPLPPAPAPPAK